MIWNPRHAERVVGCGSPVETSEYRRYSEAPTEPAGENKSFCPCHTKSFETAWFQGFFFALLRSARGLFYRILMLNLSVNFASVATCFQQFRLLHHQYSINQHRMFLSYFSFSLFTATQILTAETFELH